MNVKWRPFDYDNRRETGPESDKLVWINEVYYHGVTVGVFDGFTFRTWWGSDDCAVSHWAPIVWPEPPGGTP
jgi:hypothetical protein